LSHLELNPNWRELKNTVSMSAHRNPFAWIAQLRILTVLFPFMQQSLDSSVRPGLELLGSGSGMNAEIGTLESDSQLTQIGNHASRIQAACVPSSIL
jgi:hypothetical protein